MGKSRINDYKTCFKGEYVEDENDSFDEGADYRFELDPEYLVIRRGTEMMLVPRDLIAAVAHELEVLCGEW